MKLYAASLGILWIVLTAPAGAERVETRAPVVAIYRGGDEMSFQEVMERARQDAVRQAVEEIVGVYVRSVTRIQNLQLVQRDLAAWAEGRVHVDMLSSPEAQRQHYFDTGGEGRVEIRAWIEREALDRQVRRLERVGTQEAGSRPDASKDPVGAALYQAAAGMAGRMGSRPGGGKWRVYIDSIIGKRYPFPSPASAHLCDRLATVAQNFFDLVSRDEADFRKAQQEINATLSDAFDEATKVEPGKFSGYEARLAGTYQVSRNRMLIHLRLVSPLTTRKLALADVGFFKKDLPQDLSLEPDLTQAQKQQIVAVSGAPTGASFQLEMWPDRGDGAGYSEGDTLFVRVRASRDCYIRLFHIDNQGRMKFLYPKPPPGESGIVNKRLQAGVIYTLPGSDYHVIWRVSPPLGGIDQIKAIASTVPFTAPPDTSFSGEYRSRSIQDFITRGVEDKALTTQAYCGFKTGEKQK